MKKINISQYKGYIPFLAVLAAVYSVYNEKTLKFDQLWLDLKAIGNNPTAFIDKVKANITYVAYAAVIIIVMPMISKKVSNPYAKMAISAIGTYAASYMIIKYIIDPPEGPGNRDPYTINSSAPIISRAGAAEYTGITNRGTNNY